MPRRNNVRPPGGTIGSLRGLVRLMCAPKGQPMPAGSFFVSSISNGPCSPGPFSGAESSPGFTSAPLGQRPHSLALRYSPRCGASGTPFALSSHALKRPSCCSILRSTPKLALRAKRATASGVPLPSQKLNCRSLRYPSSNSPAECRSGLSSRPTTAGWARLSRKPKCTKRGGALAPGADLRVRCAESSPVSHPAKQSSPRIAWRSCPAAQSRASGVSACRLSQTWARSSANACSQCSAAPASESPRRRPPRTGAPAANAGDFVARVSRCSVGRPSAFSPR